MLSIRRTASLITKVRVSSGKRAFGAPAGGHGHDHADDHAHHDHPMWESIPFKKGPVALMIFGSLVGGSGLIVFACYFQNKKHGFIK